MSELPRTQFTKGDVITTKGNVSTQVFFILEGEVEIIGDGVQETRRAGQSFGEFALLTQDAESHYSFTAKTDMLCEVMDKALFQAQTSALDPFMAGLFRVLVNKLNRQ
jgi:signal-transduction protein with cAMP-binding, CBS, and nucleotidyltransferase domain